MLHSCVRGDFLARALSFAAMSALQPQTPRALIARHPTPVPLLFFGGGDETLADGSRYNPSVISFIRDEWLYQQVKARCV